MHSCQTPLALFPGLLNWRVEWISRISVGVLLINPWNTADLHLDSTCRESLDTGASLFIVARPTMTSAAFPLAETIPSCLSVQCGTPNNDLCSFSVDRHSMFSALPIQKTNGVAWNLQGTRSLHGFPPLSLALGRLGWWRSRWTPLPPAAGAQGATGLSRQISGTPGCRGVPPLSSAT